MNKKYIFLIILNLFLMDCNSSESAQRMFTPEKEIKKKKAVLYIYRPSLFMGSAISYTIEDSNDKIYLNLRNGTYKAFFLDPGEISLSAETIGSASITIDIEEEQIYFLKGNVLAGPVIAKPFLTLVPTEVGQKEIMNCRPIE
ncbi:DUF2846 domain-containing protein [Leptospira limi]|uniref:DUF2846 domain-containing protein n=1 Tax=Leptospira limi TaxID=2950023 RepID=A0ABT3LZJ0_9LEPT|nr:DUF2846 domain-containing protein [Leptospira limi]MCW7463135.1 DUF2846 domain-containing protein [Leptospira limi]